MKPVRELVFRGQDRTTLYACGKCGMAHSPKDYGGGDRGHDQCRAMAEECCVPRRCECGAEAGRYFKACPQCRKRDALRSAKQIPADDYDGPIYAEGISGSWGEGYSPDLETMLDDYQCAGLGVPSYVHPCVSKPLRLDAADILESATCDMHEDACEQIVDAGELSAFIEKWNAKQTCVSWFPDMQEVIVLDQERFDAMINGTIERREDG